MPKKIFDPNLWNLENVFKSMYKVPVYQRPYSWDSEEVNTLLDDLLEAYGSIDKYDGYFTGNIIIHDKDEKINGLINRYEIIDGQQRLTTFALLLLSLYTLAISNNALLEDKTLANIREALWKYVNREYHKNFPAISLNSIESKCFSDLYDRCFDYPKNIIEYCDKYKCESKFAERVISNFKIIYARLVNKFDSSETILNFADYLLQYVQFIAIESSCSENKVFSMFESINSKGKRLEEIDLIKTYIFSKLDKNSYEAYLDKWGQLIIVTQDNLYDYLYNYIKAFLSFYRQNITIVNFKSISKKELLTFFKTSDVSEALKKLLDDMCDKVKYYNMLSSAEDAHKLIKSSKFRFFYKIFTEISYKHPKALFLRALIEYDEGKIIKNDVIDIFVETIKFMIKFLTISGRDSKDAISMFAGIMNEIYECGSITKEIVINYIAAELIKQGVTLEKLKVDLDSIDAFEQNKKLSISLLSLYESTKKESNGKLKISYDQAYILLNSFAAAFSLDHLLVQTPNKNSVEYKYYRDENNKLVLKEGHDFPENIVINGMDYETFSKIILNRLGNLRILYKDKNSARQNTIIELKEYKKFASYSDITERSEELIKTLIESFLSMPNVDLTKIQTGNYKKIEASLPKMDKLIEYGLIKTGDKLYITTKPIDSEAILIDYKYVDFNGKKMTLNEWGCAVTGWNSIRIYAYAAIVGEIETIHQKRLKYTQDYNEEIN